MKDQHEHLNDLSEIRNLMERSSRFISLSGLSGVASGVFALAGAGVAYIKLQSLAQNYRTLETVDFQETVVFLLTDAAIVMLLSLLVGTGLTVRNSKKRGIKTWDHTAKRLLINLALPLIAGGLFCLILLSHGYIGLVAPATLLFYGLALINASKYTFNDIRYLGLCEIVLGLLGAMYMGYGLYFWAFGFGVLHIVYGAAMYFKYERSN